MVWNKIKLFNYGQYEIANILLSHKLAKIDFFFFCWKYYYQICIMFPLDVPSNWFFQVSIFNTIFVSKIILYLLNRGFEISLENWNKKKKKKGFIEIFWIHSKASIRYLKMIDEVHKKKKWQVTNWGKNLLKRLKMRKK